MEKSNGFSITPPLITLCYVTRYTDRAAPNLVAKPIIFFQFWSIRDLKNSYRQILRQLPDKKVLESLFAHTPCPSPRAP